MTEPKEKPVFYSDRLLPQYHYLFPSKTRNAEQSANACAPSKTNTAGANVVVIAHMVYSPNEISEVSRHLNFDEVAGSTDRSVARYELKNQPHSRDVDLPSAFVTSSQRVKRNKKMQRRKKVEHVLFVIQVRMINAYV